MTPAELKTIREACRLSQADLSRIVNNPHTGKNVSERTVRNWELGNYTIPQDVIDLLYHLEKQIETFAKAEVEFHKDSTNLVIIVNRFKTKEELWKFYKVFKNLPASYHAAILYRAGQLLKEHDKELCIEYR